MKIEFRKVSPQDADFALDYEGISFNGKFKRDGKFVSMQAKIEGEVILLCDRCGADIHMVLDEDVCVKVSDGYYEGEDLDVVESHDSVVDFDQIAQSEIEAIRSEYHYCEKCMELEGE